MREVLAVAVRCDAVRRGAVRRGAVGGAPMVARMGWAKGNPTRATVRGATLGVAPRPPIRGHPWAIAVGWPNGHPSKATPGPTPGGGLEATLWWVAGRRVFAIVFRHSELKLG